MSEASGYPGDSFKRDVQRYPLYFLWWTAASLFAFTQFVTQRLVAHEETAWWRYLVAWLVADYIWALLTPVILWLGRRFPLERRSWLRSAMIHIPLSIGCAAFVLTTAEALYSGLHLFPLDTRSLGTAVVEALIREFQWGVVTYWCVIAVKLGFTYYRRYREREQEVSKFALRASELQSQLMSARLSALKMQLQPHFLFNSLNAITVLVRQQKAKDAELMLGRLSDLLRGVLEDFDTHEVSLRRELEYLQLYLAIEQVRFADRLRVEISIDPAAQDASVPPLILQPIVENALRHGIGRSSSAGHILISTAKIDGRVEIRVQDDGPGFRTDLSPEQLGIGLTNTRARLQQLYGPEAGLEIESGDGGGAAVTLRFAFRDSHPEILETYAAHNADRG
jgi:signal transduction histidine kinase